MKAISVFVDRAPMATIGKTAGVAEIESSSRPAPGKARADEDGLGRRAVISGASGSTDPWRSRRDPLAQATRHVRFFVFLCKEGLRSGQTPRLVIRAAILIVENVEKVSDTA